MLSSCYQKCALVHLFTERRTLDTLQARARKIMTELGPAFVKIGQAVSCRPVCILCFQQMFQRTRSQHNSFEASHGYC